MPTAASSQRLLPDSQYTRIESKFVDIHRFQFVRDANFAHTARSVSFSETQGLAPVASLKALAQLTHDPVTTPNRSPSGNALSTTPRASLTGQTPLSSALESSLVIRQNSSSRIIKPTAPPPLKLLFDAGGDIIWSMGRSRAMENCDRDAQITEVCRPPSSLSSEDSIAAPKASPSKHSASHVTFHHRAEDAVRTDLILQSAPEVEQASIACRIPAPPPRDISALASPRSLSERAIPSSPRVPHLLQKIDPALLTPTRGDALQQSLSSSPSDALSLSGRRTSFKSKSNRLIRQLAKQSHALQERIDAMCRADNEHREAITAVGARLLGAFGYVEEMEVFLGAKPPLPAGVQYKNYHSLEQLAEVCVNLQGTGASESERLREANREVQWMSLLKQDVAAAAKEEQLANRVTAPRGNVHHPKSRHQEKRTIDEQTIARLADERSEREVRGPAATVTKLAKKYSEQAEDEIRAEEDKIKQMLVEAEAGRDEEVLAHAKFGEKSKRKRGAVVDTSAIEERLGGGTDVRLLGPQAAVDLTLYRKNPNLFSVGGQDVDPLHFPNFPFNKDELLQPRKEGVGISIFDTKKIAEDKALTDRYNRQNISEKLERTHIVRSMLQKIVTEKNGGAQEDDDVLEMQRDMAQWRRAAGQLPSTLMRGDAGERLNNEMKYMWHTTARDNGVPNLPKL